MLKYVFHVPEPGKAGVTTLTSSYVGRNSAMKAMREANVYFMDVINLAEGGWAFKSVNVDDAHDDTYLHFDWLPAYLLDAHPTDKPTYSPVDVAYEIAEEFNQSERGVIGALVYTPGSTELTLVASTGEAFKITVERADA